jgi:hypothetical protein
MATNSSQETLHGAGFSPLRGEPTMGGIPLPLKTPTLMTLTTGGGVRTLTAAEVLGGLLVVNCDDAQTATLPTAALLLASMPGAAVGQSFDVDLINTGDTTVTVAVGTGGTLATGSNSKSTVATVVSNAAKRFTIRITSMIAYGDTSDGYLVYGFGSTAAAVA